MSHLNTRRIDSAHSAYARCKQSGSEWGIKYWDGVIKALLAKNHSSVH